MIEFKKFFNLQRFANISNYYTSNSLVSGTNDDDTIYNGGQGVTIQALGGNDTVQNYYGDNSSIDGGEGADTITNYGSNSTLLGGIGDDYITNQVSFVTINGGDGNDSIINGRGSTDDQVTIEGGAGADYIKNTGSKAVIYGAADNDYIFNEATESVLIEAGTGNDTIELWRNNYSTIDAGAGNDSIYSSSGNNSSINGGAGDDSIYNYYNNNVTMNGGAGNDLISLASNSKYNVIQYNPGDGNDTIDGFNEDDTLQIGDGTGTYSAVQSDKDLIITVGEGKITLVDVMGINSLNLPSLVITGTEGADTIENRNDNVSIQALGGNDKISNNTSNGYRPKNVSISAGAGRDSIYNSGYYATIDAGAGNDYIENLNGINVTITGGAGNDEIYGGTGVVFIYNSGDGNDWIRGFNESDTLVVASGSYSTMVNGNDIFVTVGDGRITLGGAATLEEVNIVSSIANVQPVNLIENSASGTLITGTDGKDFVRNTGGTSNVTIKTGAGKDTIDDYNNSKVLIDAGAGDDSIHSNSTNVTIDGGTGNDNIYNYSNYASINGGAGNDTIYNSNNNVTVLGGAGNDKIWSYGSNVTIDAGSGNDSIDLSNRDSGNLIIYSSGLDTISGFNDSSTLQIGDGSGSYSTQRTYKDIIVTVGDGSITLVGAASLEAVEIEGELYKNPLVIQGTDNSDNINNTLNGATIQTFDGNDTVTNSGSNVRFIYTGSYDVIRGFNETSTLQIGNDGMGNYFAEKSGSDIVITTNSGQITLEGAANLSYVNIAGTEAVNPTWSLSGTTATYSTWRQVLITVNGVKSTEGLSLSGNTVTVANSSLNEGTVTISDGYYLALGGDVSTPSTAQENWNVSGSTAIYRTARTSAGYTIENNQIIYSPANNGETFIISGISPTSGVINYISVSGKTVTISKNALIAGNVTISGDGYTLALGSDVTDTIDTTPNWNISGTTATYQISFTKTTYTLSSDRKSIVYDNNSWAEKLLTVTGVKSRDGLSLSGNVVTVSEDSLAKSTVTISDGYTLALGQYVDKTVTTPASWSLNGTTATYRTASNTEGYTLNNNVITYTAAKSATNLVTVSGVKSTSGLTLNGTTVTVAASALNQSEVKISTGYTLALADDVTKSSTSAAAWTYKNNAATYKASSTTAGYSLVNGQIVYIPASGGESFTVSGVKSTSGLSLNGSTVTVAASALNQGTVSISDGYKLALANDVAIPKTTAANWSLSGSTATYKASSTSAGYSVVNNQIVYSTATDGEILATVSGVKSTEGLSVNGNVVTVSEDSLAKETVTVSDGYTLALGQYVDKSVTTPASWSLNGTTATYRTASNTEGYTLNNNVITYTAAKSATNLVTVSGVKSTSGLTLNGTTVTVAASALNQSEVKVSTGYTLALADDVTKSSTSAAAWTYKNNAATYKASSTTAGYSLVNGQIIYTPAGGGESFTVSGVKSKDGLSLSGSTVTVAASALNQSTVSISDGYKLALASDVTIPKTTAANWSLSGSTATYKASSTSAGYSVVNNQIVYSTATDGEILATVSGVKSTEGLSVNGNVVTVSEDSLAKETVTVSDGYTLALGQYVDKSVTTPASWSLNGTTATYRTASNTEGYTLNNNVITYTAAKSATNLVTVSGVKSTSGLSLKGTTVTVANSALNAGNVTISNGYTLKLGSDVKAPTETSMAGWTLDGSTANYKSATISEGYTLNNNQIVYSAISGGGTLTTIKGVTSTEGLTLNNDIITLKPTSLSKNVSLGGGYKYNLAAGDYNKTTITATKNADTLTSTGKNLSIVTGAGSDSIKVTGSATSVTGGGGNDTISNSGANNLFTYKSGDGNDVIYGFNKTSTLKITGGIYSKKDSGDDLIITVGEGSISLIGAASLPSANIDGQSSTLLTVTNSTKSPVAVGSSIKIIDATARTTAVKITGNVNANTIIGGSGADSIYGGGGNDSILGNAGADKIFGEAGADKLFGGAGNDSLNGGDGADTLSGGAGADKLLGGSGNDSLNGGDGKDTLQGDAGADKLLGGNGNDSLNGGDGADTLQGGAGNDTLTGGKGSDIFIYTAGNDLITDYEAGDKISIAGTAQVMTSGSNVIFTVGKGKITVKGGKGKVITYIDDSGENTYPQVVTLNDAKTSATLLAAYLSDGFNFADYGDALKTVNASAVVHDLKITGNKLANRIVGSDENDYIEGLAGKDTIAGGDGNDTIIGGAGNDSLKGGKGSDIFIYNPGDGNDIIADYEAEDKISVTSGAVDSINTSGKNIILTVGSGKITVKGGKDKVITYVDSSGEHTYPKTVDFNRTGATLLSNYSRDIFDINDYGDYAGTVKTINASAVAYDINITGNKLMNSILGGAGNDTLIGGKGNDSLTGGAGSDVFIYTKGDGNDIITDYAEEDKISIAGTANVTTSGNDVILTVGSGKISVKGGKDKVVTYIDSTGTNYYPKDPDPVILTGDSVTLRANYSKANYSATSKIITIDASAVTRNLKIKANALANDIFGGSGNDSINGGAGKDTISGGAGKDTILGGTGDDELYGGEGADIFVYAQGGGKDIIWDYAEEDKIKITSGSIKSAAADGKDIVYKIGSGSITVKNALNKNISLVNSSGKAITAPTITSANVPYWFIQDDLNFSTDTQLATITETSEAYSFDEMQPSTNLTQENILITFSSEISG